MLREMICKLSEYHEKQQEILISTKELLQALLLGLPGAVGQGGNGLVGSGSGSGDHPSVGNEENDLTSSKSSQESTGGDVYTFPDAELDKSSSKEDLAFRLGNLILFALNCSLKVPNIWFSHYLQLGVVPFVVDMRRGVEDVMEDLECDMKVLDMNRKDGKSWRNCQPSVSCSSDR